MHVELGHDAARELEDATQWYLAHGLDHGPEAAWELAERFVEEVERGIGLIAEHPTLHAEIEPGVRRIVLRSFPYSLIYSMESDFALVLAVMHHRRSPGYWRDRRRR